MAELAKAHGIKVVLASILPDERVPHRTGRGATHHGTAAPRIRAINAWIKDYAATNEHTYLDYFSAMVDEKGCCAKELSADDLHPNAKGYAVMGPLADAAIAERAAGSLIPDRSSLILGGSLIPNLSSARQPGGRGGIRIFGFAIGIEKRLAIRDQ